MINSLNCYFQYRNSGNRGKTNNLKQNSKYTNSKLSIHEKTYYQYKTLLSIHQNKTIDTGTIPPHRKNTTNAFARTIISMQEHCHRYRWTTFEI